MQELIESYCKLACEVAKEIYEFPKIPADCFCGKTKPMLSFEHDPRILEFIKQAVYEKIAKER